MSVVKLTIKNFLSVQDVEINPGKVNQIVGKNNQGKTTILKALEFAFKGSTDGSLVKHGEDSAEVIVELDNEMTIKRRINSNGKQSVAVTKGGFKADSPQSFLASLFDGMSFNPLEILNPKTRNEFILKALNLHLTRDELAEITSIPAAELPPLDYEKENALVIIEQAYKYFYQRRAEANRVVSEKKTRWETYKADLPEDIEPPKSRNQIQAEVEQLKSEKAGAEKIKAEIEREHQEVASVNKKLVLYDGELQKINQEIEMLKANYEKSLAILMERKSNGKKALNDAKKSIPNRPRDLGPIDEEIDTLNKHISDCALELKDIAVWEAQQKQRQAVSEMEREFKSAESEAKKIDERVRALGQQAKDNIMKKTDLPIEGLSYSEGEFTMNGSSLDHLSSSMALRVSLALVKKLADKTKMICIDGAELLDSETFEALRGEMGADEFTYFFTKVGEPFDGVDRVYKASAGSLRLEAKA